MFEAKSGVMAFNIRVVNIDQEKEWKKYVLSANNYDFYHTWEYHQMDENGDPFLFIYEEDNKFIALPFLKRAIPNSSYFDCTSVYGYAGPLTNFPDNLFTKDVIVSFRDSLIAHLKENKIIAAFSRFHPIINQSPVWDHLETLQFHGRTVSIDLNQDIEEQRKKYQRTVRAKVKQLQKKGFTVREAESEKDLDAFVDLYTENMQKVNANSYYYFDKNYFLKILNSTDYQSRLVVCCEGDTVTAGTIVTFVDGILQFHLAATKNEYLKEGPMKLLIDGVSQLGRKYNMHFMHLGGGVGGHEDNLFKFKAGFSDILYDFKTWRFIVNPSVYSDLVNERVPVDLLDSKYFPLYRISDIILK